MKPPIAATALLAMVLSTGCFRTTIRSGRAPTPEPLQGYDDKWRSTTVLDVVEIDKPLPLDLLCKDGGWAEIEQRMSPLNWLVDVFLAGFVYESDTIVLRCARAPAGSPPAGTPPPPPPKETPPVSL